MLAIDSDALLIGFAVFFGGIALSCVFIIHLSESIYNKEPDKYIARLPSRFAAILIDIAILRLALELILIFLIPGYVSPIFFPAAFISLNPLSISAFAIVAIILSLSSYLFFYILILGNAFSLTSILVGLSGFLYFFVFDAFLEGKTIGRYLLRLKTLHQSKTRTVSPGEACVNAIGKTFLLLDLFLGALLSLADSHNRGLRQFRMTQRLARAVTIDIHYDMSKVDNSEPFLQDESGTGS